MSNTEQSQRNRGGNGNVSRSVSEDFRNTRSERFSGPRRRRVEHEQGMTHEDGCWDCQRTRDHEQGVTHEHSCPEC